MRPVAVDGVVFDGGKVLLVKRKKDPFKGLWALPGGHVEENETVEDALVREVLEETGFRVEPIVLVGVFSNPERDPRGNVSVAFISRVVSGDGKPGSDASEIGWFPIDDLPKLAFDHLEIVKKALEYLAFIKKLGKN